MTRESSLSIKRRRGRDSNEASRGVFYRTLSPHYERTPARVYAGTYA